MQHKTFLPLGVGKEKTRVSLVPTLVLGPTFWGHLKTNTAVLFFKKNESISESFKENDGFFMLREDFSLKKDTVSSSM